MDIFSLTEHSSRHNGYYVSCQTLASENMEGLFLDTVMASISKLNSHSQLAPLTSANKPTVLTWNRLEAACLACDEYKLLHRTVQKGVSDRREDWDHQIRPAQTLLGHNRPSSPTA